MRLSPYLPAVFVTSLAACAALAEPPPAAVDVGSRRELFVDNFLVDRLSGTELRMHRPHDEGVVMKFDAPWEGRFCAYVTVIRTAPDKYQMFYRGLGHSSGTSDKDGATCYAESTDGKTWVKPQLDLFPGPDGGKSNIVLAHAGKVTHDFSPFIDANPTAAPDQRYKAMGGYDDAGLFAYVSPDGIHWTKLQDDPVLKRTEAWPSFAFDSQNVPFWSQAEGKYVLFYRVYKDHKRRIARMESSDFVHWTNVQLMEYRGPDGQPAPIEQLYTNQTHPYFRAPHIYVSTAARFMQDRQVLTTQQATAVGVDPHYFHDSSDAILLTSRGGDIYDRTFLTAFISPGIGYENWVSRTNYPALNVVQTGPAEMSVYANQNYGQPTSCLHRYSLRLDGFASVHAEYDRGEMLTKPLTFSGGELFLNFSTSAAGGIRVEVQDAAGKPIDGYALQDCQEVIGNELDRAVHWTGGDLKKLSQQPIRLRFVMNDADLYSLRFGDPSPADTAASAAAGLPPRP